MSTTQLPTQDPFAGTPYRTLRLLDGGGGASVYLVEDRETDRRCAAKVLDERSAHVPRAIDRLRLEAQALGRLEHPHIVTILAVGTTADGRPYLVTEHLQGNSLAAELQMGGARLPVLEAVAYGCQLTSALAAAHQIGLVHRSVAPSKLFLCDRPGGVKILKVLDFGLTRVLPGFPDAPAPLHTATEDGLVLGEPGYVSPEVLGGAPADPRSDIYAAGVVLYRMLAGRGPFDEAQDTSELLALQTRADPVAPSHGARSPVPAELDRLILRALAQDPAERYQTAAEVCTALDEIGMALAGPVGWAETLGWAKTGALAGPGVSEPAPSRSFSSPDGDGDGDGDALARRSALPTPRLPAQQLPAQQRRAHVMTFVAACLVVMVVVLGAFGVALSLR